MKKLFFIYCILIAALLYSKPCFCQKNISADSMIKIENEKRGALIGTPYPLFNVTLNNKTYSSKTLKGKTLFVNFWFAACVPCMEEMEDLNKLYERFKGNKNFEFISFTFDDKNTIAAIKKKYNIGYNIFSITNEECHRLNLHGGFPTSIVVDAAGNIKYISRLTIKDNFIDNIYPLISKE